MINFPKATRFLLSRRMQLFSVLPTAGQINDLYVYLMRRTGQTDEGLFLSLTLHEAHWDVVLLDWMIAEGIE